MKEHFLQSSLWEQYETLEGNQTFRLQGDHFSILAIKKSTPLGTYLFCPYGPTVDSSDSLPAALDALKTLAREQNAFFVRLEPTFPLSTNQISALHLKKSHDLDPAHTWILDLNVPEEQLLHDMDKERSRLWRNHAKKGISIRTTKNPEEITILTNLLAKVSDKNHFTPQAVTHLQNQLKSGFATLYIAELETPETPETPEVSEVSEAPNSPKNPKNPKIPIAASLVYDYDSTRFYAHAASDYAHRNLAASGTLLVQMIIDAKNQGSKSFDFWGITTSKDPKHPWYGFTKFKKSFGGRQVDYAGTYDLPLNPLRFQLYLFIRHLNRLKRKILP